MNASTRLPTVETTIRCRVAAVAALRACAAALVQRRKHPVVGAEKLPASFLKHADDQTVLGLMTVLAALDRAGWHGRSFTDWGVLAAANLFSRVSIAQTIQRYQQEGAWGVPPNLIPHQSLHAISGTISQALKIYGPNFGIGGGPNAMPDAFLIAAAMMSDRRLPGLWLVLTGYESEWIPSADGGNPPAPECQVVALALTPADANTEGLHLSIGLAPTDASKDLSLSLPEMQLEPLAQACETKQPAGKWRLGDTHWLELEAAPGGHSCLPHDQRAAEGRS